MLLLLRKRNLYLLKKIQKHKILNLSKWNLNKQSQKRRLKLRFRKKLKKRLRSFTPNSLKLKSLTQKMKDQKSRRLSSYMLHHQMSSKKKLKHQLWFQIKSRLPQTKYIRQRLTTIRLLLQLKIRNLKKISSLSALIQYPIKMSLNKEEIRNTPSNQLKKLTIRAFQSLTSQKKTKSVIKQCRMKLKSLFKTRKKLHNNKLILKKPNERYGGRMSK